MKLSELVFSAIKNVRYLDDPGFTYEAFIAHEYDNDPDYTNQMTNAYAPINEAIHRLSDRDKVKYIVESIGYPDDKGVLSLADVSRPIKTIKSIFRLSGCSYQKVEWREFTEGKVLVLFPLRGEHLIQYSEDIKSFSASDWQDGDDEDLKTYGITDTMCSYIIEYVQGRLQEPIAPEIANLHLNRAEQYFEDLDEQQTMFSQTSVTKRYSIDA